MTDYLNVNIPVPNQDACGNISWMRIKAGALGNSLVDLKMCGNIDMDGFNILNQGGTGGNITAECLTLTDTPAVGAKLCADGYSGLREYQIDESNFLNARVPVIEGVKAVSNNTSFLPSIQSDANIVGVPTSFTLGSGTLYSNPFLMFTRVDNVYDISYTVTGNWTTGVGNVIALSLPLPMVNPSFTPGSILIAHVSFAPTVPSDPQLLTFSLTLPLSTDLNLTLAAPLAGQNYRLAVTYKTMSQ